jgi:hypothetical protein
LQIKIIATPTRAYRDQSKLEVCGPLPREPECKNDDFCFVRYRRSSDDDGGTRKRKRRRRVAIKPWLPNEGGWDATLRVVPPSFQDPWTVPLHLRYNNEEKGRTNPRLQYYHSRSRLPMRVEDWEVDSDDESDNDWVDALITGVRCCVI